MRIAIIGTKGIPAKWGGIEKYVDEIGKRLVLRGHDVTVFGSKWYLKEYTGKWYQGVRIIKVPAIHSQSVDALSNGFFATIYTLFSKYDIVNFHGYGSYFFVPIIKFTGKITVITSHGLIDRQWRNPKYGEFALNILRNAGKIGIQRGDYVTTVAPYWKKRIMEEYGVNAHILASGLDTAKKVKPDIIKMKYGLYGDDYILFLGRIDPIKRVDWVIDLAGKIGNKYKVVIAGGVQDSKTENYLKQLKKRVGDNDNVVFTGAVAGKEKSELFGNCKLLINPSSSEGLPVVALEAMSYGKVCIASNIPGHREIIAHGENGFLFNSESKKEFYAIARKCVEMEKNVFEKIGTNARQNVSEVYNWDRTARHTEELYVKFLEDRKARKNKS